MLVFDIYLVWSNKRETLRDHDNPVKHYATFANVELANVTFYCSVI